MEYEKSEIYVNLFLSLWNREVISDAHSDFRNYVKNNLKEIQE